MKKYCRSSSDSSTVSVRHMELMLEKLKANQARSSTIRNYMSIWRKFNKFLLRLDDRKRVNTWEKRVVIYGTYLVEQKAQSQTIKSYFSAIKYILQTDGYIWNVQVAMLDVITKSCQLINDRIKIRLPIRIHLLEQVLFEVQRTFHDQRYLRAMYQALFSIGYYGMMRIGEMTLSDSEHYVRAKDVLISFNNDKIKLKLHTSKTHGRRSKPQEIRITRVEMTNVKRFFCPFVLMRKYISYRGVGYETEEEPFFIHRDASPVKADLARNTLQDMLEKLNLNPALYDTMSLRSGRCVDMYKMGYSLEVLK